MQALGFDRPALDTGATRVMSIAAPTPGPGQVAVRVAYAGINFKDVMARRGDPGYVSRWPFVPGVEIAGTIIGIGPGVTTHREGDHVVALTNQGGLAEIALADAALTVALTAGVNPAGVERAGVERAGADPTGVERAGVDLARAATAPGALTTAVLLHDQAARIRTGDVVLVHSAAGAVGRALADVARTRSGARLIGVVGAASRIDAAHDAGYPDVFVRGETPADEVRTATGGRGADVVLDPQGTTFLDRDLAMLAPGGRIILFGNASGATLAPLPPTQTLYSKNASVGGFSLAAFSAAAPETVAAALHAALEMLAAGHATADPIVVAGLAAAPAAQQALADGTGQGKYVVKIQESA